MWKKATEIRAESEREFQKGPYAEILLDVEAHTGCNFDKTSKMDQLSESSIEESFFPPLM